MALNIAKQGYISVAVDNAAAGEAADLEPLTGTSYDYDTPSRILLELGWSYLGYTSFLNKQVLEWMKCQPFIRKDRIVVSGFSLGTEPLMVLGVMDPSIYAFVYNDFLCQTQERAIVMTEPDQRGRRPFPNSIRHFLLHFPMMQHDTSSPKSGNRHARHQYEIQIKPDEQSGIKSLSLICAYRHNCVYL